MATVIIDYGCGNLRSLAAACRHVGMETRTARAPKDIWAADALILPGVGSYLTAMRQIGDLGIGRAIIEHAAGGRHMLGICLGMQLMMDWSDENDGVQGLGLFKGDVRKLPDTAAPIPNVGWRSIRPGASWSGTLLAEIEPGSRFYFSHSYACHPAHDEYRLAVSDYAGDEVCAAVQRGNVTGLQFHPEKSGEAGLAVLRAWRGIVEQGEMAA